MPKLFVAAGLGLALIVLNGCNRYCEDCDAAAERGVQNAVLHCNDCVPAPAPLAEQKTATVEAPPKPIAPLPAPVRVTQNVEIQRVESERPRRVHHVLSGEIEPQDL